jgi:hypothetical protein
VKFPPSYDEFSTFLNRVKETERVIRQEEDFTRKVRSVKAAIQLESTEHKPRKLTQPQVEEDPPVEANTFFIIPPGKVPSSGLMMPRQSNY